MKNKLKARIIGAAEMRRIERNTIWVLTCLDRKNREQFLGAYPAKPKANKRPVKISGTEGKR